MTEMLPFILYCETDTSWFPSTRDRPSNQDLPHTFKEHSSTIS